MTVDANRKELLEIKEVEGNFSDGIKNIGFPNEEKMLPRFHEFGKTFFQLKNEKKDLVVQIKEQSIFRSIPFPENLEEPFVFIEDCPAFWTFSTPVNDFISEIYQLNQKRLQSNKKQKIIVELYQKWVKSLNGNYDKYFALSVISQLENVINNAFNLILHSMVLTFDKGVFNPPKALELIEESEKIIISKKIEDRKKNEILYMLDTIRGFIFIKSSSFSEARTSLLNALVTKPNGITAKFHLALTELALNNTADAAELAEEIYEYDKKRMEFAAKTNNINIFSFLLETSVCQYFFKDQIFAGILPAFESIVDEVSTSSGIVAEDLKVNYLKLKGIKMFDHKSSLVDKSLQFIEKFLNKYYQSPNLIVMDSMKKIEEKFLSTIDEIFRIIEKFHFNQIAEKLKIYDLKIEECEEKIKILQEELTTFDEKIEKKSKLALEHYRNALDDHIASLERQMDRIPENAEFDSAASFKNSMTYNFILSGVVLLLGGFAEYSNASDLSDIASFNNILSTVIFSGSKWGIITFILGVFISFLISVSTSLEKNKEKSKLKKNIVRLKEERDKNSEKIKSDTISSFETHRARTLKRIELNNGQIVELQEKRIKDEASLKETAKAKVIKEIGDLKEIRDFYEK